MRNIGNDLIESLKSSNQVDWIFTDKEDADAGVVSQEYYAELIIPKDFTKNITSAGSETKIQGTLYFKATDKKGMMASSILDNLSSNIEATVNRSISESIVDKLTISLESLPTGLQQLSDGLNKLEQGSAQLQQSVLSASPTLAPIIQGLTQLNSSIKLIKSSVDISLTQVY